MFALWVTFVLSGCFYFVYLPLIIIPCFSFFGFFIGFRFLDFIYSASFVSTYGAFLCHLKKYLESRKVL